MIAAPELSPATVAVAHMRRLQAARPAADPAHAPNAAPTTNADAITSTHERQPHRPSSSTPQPLTPLDPDWSILLDYLDAATSLTTLCTKHALSPDELTAWLATPPVRAAIAALHAAAAQRTADLAPHIPEAARATHIAILSQPIPDDPRLAARRAETARKSANALARLTPSETTIASPNAPARGMAVALHSHVEEPTSPPPPTDPAPPRGMAVALHSHVEEPTSPPPPTDPAPPRGMAVALHSHVEQPPAPPPPTDPAPPRGIPASPHRATDLRSPRSRSMPMNGERATRRVVDADSRITGTPGGPWSPAPTRPEDSAGPSHGL